MIKAARPQETLLRVYASTWLRSFNDQPVCDCEQWLPRAHDPMHFLKLVDMCQPSESDRVSVFVSNILLACFVHLSALSERPPGWMRFPFIMQCFNDFH